MDVLTRICEPGNLEELLHNLWTLAKGQSGYDKDKWLRLEAGVNELRRLAKIGVDQVKGY